MTQGQFESVSAEALALAGGGLQAESVAAEVLEIAPSTAVIETVDIEVLETAPSTVMVEMVGTEVLIPSLLVTTVAQMETVFAEVLTPSPVRLLSNIWDSDGVEHEVYRWDGSQLVFVTFGVG